MGGNESKVIWSHGIMKHLVSTVRTRGGLPGIRRFIVEFIHTTKLMLANNTIVNRRRARRQEVQRRRTCPRPLSHADSTSSQATTWGKDTVRARAMTAAIAVQREPDLPLWVISVFTQLESETTVWNMPPWSWSPDFFNEVSVFWPS